MDIEDAVEVRNCPLGRSCPGTTILVAGRYVGCSRKGRWIDNPGKAMRVALRAFCDKCERRQELRNFRNAADALAEKVQDYGQVIERLSADTDELLREHGLKVHAGRLYRTDPDTGAITEPLRDALGRADAGDGTEALREFAIEQVRRVRDFAINNLEGVEALHLDLEAFAAINALRDWQPEEDE